MARKTKIEKQIEEAVDAAFRKHGQGVQIDVMDIPKILAAGRAEYQHFIVGSTHEEALKHIDLAVLRAVTALRKN